ncbi:MAG: zinc-ribbon domain containing protein [Anaerolineae bacterium]
MQDKTLRCRECGQDFVFTAGEQEFYAQRGLANAPGRCPSCRAAARASRGGDRMGGGGSRSMYDAVCAQCGKECQVPFQPREDRPVYCSDCYSAQRGEGGRGDRRPGGGGRRDRY